MFDEVVEALRKSGIHNVALRQNALRADCEPVDLNVVDISGLEVVQVDGPRAGDGKQSLLRAIAEACSFPDYFGMNWAALRDSLEELPEERNANVLLVFTDYSALVESLPSKELDNLLDTIEEVGPGPGGGADFMSVSAIFCRGGRF